MALSLCVNDEPTLFVFVVFGDDHPIIGANALGGDVLTDSLCVRPNCDF